MKINFVDLQRQNKRYRNEFYNAVTSIVDRADFISGKAVGEFENAFAKFCNRDYCVGVNSGTDALFLTLVAKNVGPGDEVITAPNSYFSSAMVIELTGAKAIFADIDPKTYLIDPKEIEKKITTRTKAIIPIHLCGQIADMTSIQIIAKKYNLFILEDCCQAHGAKQNQEIAPITGTGAFSFYPGKNLGAFGDGGAIVTDDKNLANSLRLLRNDGALQKYRHERFGYKSRLDTLQASVLIAKLKHLHKWNEARQKHAEKYRKALQELSEIQMSEVFQGNYHIYHLFIIEAQKRNKLQTYLTNNGISTVIHYPIPIHLQKAFSDRGFKKGDFPHTEQAAEKILSLPMFPELKETEIKYIISKIKQFYA